MIIVKTWTQNSYALRWQHLKGAFENRSHLFMLGHESTPQGPIDLGPIQRIEIKLGEILDSQVRDHQPIKGIMILVPRAGQWFHNVDIYTLQISK